MAFDLGQAMQGFPLAPGQVVLDPNDPNAIGRVLAGGNPPGMTPPILPPPQPDDPAMRGGPAGEIGKIPVALHPTLRGKIGALMSDQNFNNALIVAGANMMQSPQRGQNLGDIFGQSVLAGMNAYQGGKAKDQAATDKKKKEAADAQKGADQVSLENEKLQLGKDELAQRREEAAARERASKADNQSRENIARMQAARAAGGGAGGNMSQLEFAHGEAVKAYEALGMTHAQAQVKATQDVILSQKPPSDESIAQKMYGLARQQAMAEVGMDPSNLRLTPQQRAQMIDQRSVEIAQGLQKTYQSLGGGQPTTGWPVLPGQPNAQPGQPIVAPAPGAPPAQPAAPPAAAPQAAAPTVGIPASIAREAPATPATPRSGFSKGMTATNPLTMEEAQAAADRLNKTLEVWVIGPNGQPVKGKMSPTAKK